MDYSIFISKSMSDSLKNYFDINPFTMQAAFALAETNERPDCNTIFLSDFQRLKETDYESRTQHELSFYSKALLNTLHETSYRDRLSFIYIHSLSSIHCCNFENEDHKMIFRISYAYMPFGIHASLLYAQGEISGKVWLPTLSTEPLNIVYE